ncbi:MAG: tRNA pseudouridine(38-40) synthase TruA [Chloroflexi bacterium RBG_19FT_COMBO_47_9]|nr:MAG: tRNA pseudouridine(38-40) synthase TruA [Chloroflexi bacterium RBG_19FT_COMBO_47_9]
MWLGVNPPGHDRTCQPSMERYQVILAYDGSHFKGFQRQANARSVQGVVENALHKLNWQGKSILAAGRTDTGAHATGQVIAFDLDWDHDPQDLKQALNKLLPQDVVAREVERVRASFHPRYDASWRKYFYRIYCQPMRDPFRDPYAWRVWPVVDLNNLREAAQPLIGTHDFSAFGTPPHSGGNTSRCVLETDWKQETPYLVFEIVAHAFLYHMVRRLAFMQVRIAQGKLNISDLINSLAHGNDLVVVTATTSSKRLVHGLAPARGLILAEVHYPLEAVRLEEDAN